MSNDTALLSGACHRCVRLSAPSSGSARTVRNNLHLQNNRKSFALQHLQHRSNVVYDATAGILCCDVERVDAIRHRGGTGPLKSEDR